MAPVPLRLAVGAALLYHGWQRLFVEDIQDLVAQVDGFGLPSPDVIAQVMAWGGLAGGGLLILGFACRLGALVNAASLGLYLWKAKLEPEPGVIDNLTQNFDAASPGGNGYEYVLVLFAACLTLLLSGAGALSVDGFLAGKRGTPAETT